MTEAYIFLSQEKVNHQTIETYQLFTENDGGFSTTYDSSRDRNSFFENVTDDFVQMMIENKSISRLRISNGYVVDSEAREIKNVGRLEKELTNAFTQILFNKLNEIGSVENITPSMN